MKKCSIFHLPFSISFVSLPFLYTGNGKQIRFICNFLLAAKLKIKSSNSSSAALGIGVSAIISSVESAAVVSTRVESVAKESAPSTFLSLQLLLVTHSEQATINAIMKNKLFFIVNLCIKNVRKSTYKN